jgi:hypothetical protein
MIDCPAARQQRDVRAERAAPLVVGLRAPPELCEHLLDHVFGRHGVAQDAQRRRERLGTVAPVGVVEGGRIAKVCHSLSRKI